MQHHELRTDFLADLRSNGRSPATVAQYGWHVDQFLTWLGQREIDKRTLRAWRAYLFDRWEPPTVKVAVTVIRSFLRFCHAEGVLPEDYSPLLKTPKVPKKVQRTLTADEIALLLAQCDSQTPKGIRDAAIISLLVDSGLRSAELRRLKIDDLDLDRGQLRVKRKGGNVGVAFFGRATAKQLRQWLDVRGTHPQHDEVFLSVGGLTPGKPLTSRGLRMILKRIGDAAGVEGVSPHAFRRSFAILLVEAGAPTRLIQEMGGWSDLRQVERYTRALETQKLAQRYSAVDRLLNGSIQLVLPLSS